MNNIIKQQDKHYIKCDVVMLATEAKSNMLLHKQDRKLFYSDTPIIEDMLLDNPQHLYLTSDQLISVGDWYIYAKWLFKSDDDSLKGNTDCKKIIATTDPKLTSASTDYSMGIDITIPELPQIPQSFIKSYCDSKGSVDSVLVKVEYVQEIHNPNPKYDFIKIKTNSNHEVIITSTKTSWSREELIGNSKGSLDEYLLNSDQYTQKERELVMKVISNYTR